MSFVLCRKNDENNMYDVEESQGIWKKQYQLVSIKYWLNLTMIQKCVNKYVTDTQAILQIMLVF